MRKYLLVCVDTNDADYVERLKPITDEDLATLIPLIESIKQFKPYSTKKDGLNWEHTHNFPCGEILREDLGERGVEALYKEHSDALQLFQENYLPYGEYGCHTLKSIRVLTVIEDEQLMGDR